MAKSIRDEVDRKLEESFKGMFDKTSYSYGSSYGSNYGSNYGTKSNYGTNYGLANYKSRISASDLYSGSPFTYSSYSLPNTNTNIAASGSNINWANTQAAINPNTYRTQ